MYCSSVLFPPFLPYFPPLNDPPPLSPPPPPSPTNETNEQETKYSRIPVYSGEIDRISGVVLSKDLLDFVQEPEKLSSVLVADETESTYFVPETMSVWNVLEEVRGDGAARPAVRPSQIYIYI